MRKYLAKLDWNNMLRNKTAVKCRNIIKYEIESIIDKFVPLKKRSRKNSAVPESRTQLAVHSYSTALSMSKAQVSVLKDDICVDDITGFVTCRYDSQWWLGSVMDTSADTEEVTISFLHLCGLYPRNPDMLVTHCTNVWTKVDPTTATGRTYQLGATQQATATKTLPQ